MSNNLRTRNGMPFNFVNGLKVRGMDIESLIPGIEGIPEAGSKYQFAGNGSNKVFTLPVTPYNKDAVDVYVKQLYVHPDDYTLVGDTVTLVEAPPAVVAGETYNVVIKVSLTTLNGYVNANRVSFEGENLDVVLAKSKPLANYSNLRAYAGAATQVRITDPGIAGFFYYDSSDSTSVDNGGTVIVAGTKRWKRHYTGAVDVMWFGAKGDWNGTTGTDNTSAFQNAINFLLSKKSATPLGVGTLFLPKGNYLVNGTITGNSVFGFIVQGSGDAATTITRTVDTGDLFAFSVYGNISFRDVYIQHLTSTDYTTWTSVAFNMNGYGGGYHFELSNVRTDKFGTIVKYTSPTPANEDTNHFSRLRCSNFKTFLYTRSAQAVINSIKNSTFFGTCQSVFDIGGFGHTLLDTCNIVVSGRIFDLYTTGGRSSIYTLNNCKFEYWPQGGAIGTTQLIVFNNDSFATFKFSGGGLVGGTPNPSIKQIVSRNTAGNIVFENGCWSTDIKVDVYKSVTTSVFGAKPHSNSFIKFKNCTESPLPTNVTYVNDGAVGASSFPGVVWEDCYNVPNLALTGSANGPSYNSSVPSNNVLNKNTFSSAASGGVIMNGATPTTLPVPHYGQPALVRKISVVFISSGVLANCNIKVYSDAAKTNLLIMQAVPNGAIATYTTYDLVIPQNTVITEGVYVEISNTNGVFAYGRVYVETMSI